MEKYEYLIELGKDLPIINSNQKTEENLIKGCQSKVWLHAEYANNKVSFSADSEAIITKGIIALLVRVLNNQSPKSIMDAKLNFITEIGLTNHLSPTRANGLLEMVKQMKAYAYALMLKNN
jgi:cysteine desulfuration protein SufE